MTATDKKRAIVEEIIEGGLLEIIERGIESCGGNKSYEYCKGRWGGGDLAVAVLASWMEDEDGWIAVDRLVTLIMH